MVLISCNGGRRWLVLAVPPDTVNFVVFDIRRGYGNADGCLPADRPVIGPGSSGLRHRPHPTARADRTALDQLLGYAARLQISLSYRLARHRRTVTGGSLRRRRRHRPASARRHLLPPIVARLRAARTSTSDGVAHSGPGPGLCLCRPGQAGARLGSDPYHHHHHHRPPTHHLRTHRHHRHHQSTSPPSPPSPIVPITRTLGPVVS